MVLAELMWRVVDADGKLSRHEEGLMRKSRPCSTCGRDTSRRRDGARRRTVRRSGGRGREREHEIDCPRGQ